MPAPEEGEAQVQRHTYLLASISPIIDPVRACFRVR